MDLQHTLQQQLQQLFEQAEHIDAQPVSGKPQHWFDSTLFSCRSSKLSDYVAEAQRNLQRLMTRPASSPAATQQLVQRLSEQTTALTRAFINQDTRRKSTGKKRKVQIAVEKITASSQQLYQQLSEYQEFERRLLDMVELCNRHPAENSTERLLALHARLGRCRKAISDVEANIQKLEKPL